MRTDIYDVLPGNRGSGSVRTVRAAVAAAAVFLAAPAVHAQALPLMGPYETALLAAPGQKDFSSMTPGGSHLGGFQFTPAALQEAGFQNADGSWSATAQAMGVSSMADFLRNPTAQVLAADRLEPLQLGYLQNAMGAPAYSAQLGKADRSGTVMTPSAMAFCAQTLGAGGCASYLEKGVLPAPILAAYPGWADGAWQRKLATAAGGALPAQPVADQSKAPVSAGNGWLHVKQMNVLQPAPADSWLADLWLHYGSKALPGARALPLTYQVYERAGTKTVVGIALSPGCDMGENDASSTQLHAVCPATVISSGPRGVQVHTFPEACYLWTANEPPGSDSDPNQDATYTRLDAASGQIGIVTMRHGKPIPECSKSVAF